MPAFHHVSLLTRHAKDNVDFYTRLLGLRFVKNTVNQENHRMLHYYYGDYSGAPGTVVTFFVVPHLGQRYDNDHYLATIGLNIPENSLPFWEHRLSENEVAFEKNGSLLTFEDVDGVKILLEEVHQPPLAQEQQVKNDVPGDYQIIGLRSTEFHVKEPEKTIEFFSKLLEWQAQGNRIQLSETEFIDILPTETTEPARMGRGSMDHVAFAIFDEDELEQLYQKAQSQGWNIEEIVSRGYFKSLYIREPGGNRVEFATMAPGFTIDEPLEHLGESLALPPFLQEQRAEIEANIYPEA